MNTATARLLHSTLDLFDILVNFTWDISFKVSVFHTLIYLCWPATNRFAQICAKLMQESQYGWIKVVFINATLLCLQPLPGNCHLLAE